MMSREEHLAHAAQQYRAIADTGALPPLRPFIDRAACLGFSSDEFWQAVKAAYSNECKDGFCPMPGQPAQIEQPTVYFGPIPEPDDAIDGE